MNDLEITIRNRYASEEQTHLIYLVSYEEERMLSETLKHLSLPESYYNQYTFLGWEGRYTT